MYIYVYICPSECYVISNARSVQSESAVTRNKWLIEALFLPILWSSDKPSTLWINTSNLMFGLTWNLKRASHCFLNTNKCTYTISSVSKRNITINSNVNNDKLCFNINPTSKFPYATWKAQFENLNFKTKAFLERYLLNIT